MARTCLAWCRFTILMLIQLLFIGVYLSILIAPARSQTPSPKTTASVGQFAAFLDLYPIGKSAEYAEHLILWHQHQNDLIGYRIFKDRKPVETAQKTADTFKAECAQLGGHFQITPDPQEVKNVYSTFLGRASSGRPAPVFCLDGKGRPLAGLYAYYTNHRVLKKHVALLLLKPELVAEMLFTYQFVQDRSKAIAAENVRNAESREYRWELWRSELVIGAESNCGPVISLRGPMVEVANAGKPGLFRRTEIFPAGATDSGNSLIRCGQFDPL